MQKQRWFWLLMGLAFGVTGCNRQDTECLANVSRRVVARTENLSGGIKASWKGHWPSPSLSSKVAGRLRWDKMLADATLEVHAQGGEVELKGTVQNEEQRRRAVELAETTAGVEKVTDLLQLPAALP